MTPSALQAFAHDDLLIDHADGVLILIFNRPDRGNPIAAEMTAILAGLFDAAQADPSVRCVVVRGAGAHLSAGGDVAGFSRALELTPDQRAAEFTERLTRAAEMVTAVLSFDRPIVTAHRGAAAGAGLLFTLAADVVVADDSAAFLFSHQKIGLPPDGGVSVLLPRIVGWRAARRLVLSGARVDAPEALKLGLLDRIHPAEAVENEITRIVAGFSRAPQGAMGAAKRLLNAPVLADLAAGLQAETRAIAQAVRHDDFAEGVRAFLEKRRADFPSAR